MVHKAELAIVAALSKIIKAYPDEAPVDATYPYAVVSFRRLGIDDNISNWVVEINVWDKHKYNSRAESKADAIESELDFKRIMIDNSLMCLYKSQREDIEDSDDMIKRVRCQFGANIYESEAET